MPKMIYLKDIDTENSPKVRSEIRFDVCLDYCEKYKQKKHGMPPPVLFKVDGNHLVGDGLHRIEAMVMAGLDVGIFDVREGTWEDCVRFALLANTHHGVRRSNADKRQCVIQALREFTRLSNRSISELCAVGDDLVSEVRKDLQEKETIPKVDKRVAKDGRTLDAGDAPAKPKKKGPGEAKDKDTVAARTAVQPASEVRDSTGYPVPPKALIFWKRRNEALALVNVLRQLKHELKEAVKNKDLLFVEMNWNAVEADIERLDTGLDRIVPHATCVSCQGKLVETCKLCKGRGVTSKFLYDTAPSELKKIREGKK